MRDDWLKLGILTEAHAGFVGQVGFCPTCDTILDAETSVSGNFGALCCTCFDKQVTQAIRELADTNPSRPDTFAIAEWDTGLHLARRKQAGELVDGRDLRRAGVYGPPSHIRSRRSRRRRR